MPLFCISATRRFLNRLHSVTVTKTFVDEMILHDRNLFLTLSKILTKNFSKRSPLKTLKIFEVLFWVLKSDQAEPFTQFLINKNVHFNLLKKSTKLNFLFNIFCDYVVTLYYTILDHNVTDKNINLDQSNHLTLLNYLELLIKSSKLVNAVDYDMYTNTVEEMEVLKILFVESYSLHCKETNCIVRLTSQVSQFSTLSVQKFIMLLKEFEGVQDTFVQHKAESKNFGRISETHILHTKYLSELLNEKIVRKQEEVGCREVDQKVVEFGVETQKTFITNVLKTLEIISKQLLLMSSKHSKSYQSNSSPFTQKSILNMTHSRRGTL